LLHDAEGPGQAGRAASVRKSGVFHDVMPY